MAYLLAEGVITATVGNWFLFKTERIRCANWSYSRWILFSGYQIKDDLTADSPVRYSGATGPLGNVQPMYTGCAQNLDKLPVTAGTRQ